MHFHMSEMLQAGFRCDILYSAALGDRVIEGITEAVICDHRTDEGGRHCVGLPRSSMLQEVVARGGS